MGLDRIINAMRKFHGDAGWKPIVEAYRRERGYAEGWAFSEADKKELASRFAKHLTNGGR